MALPPINTEIDSVLKLSFKHLHSSNADSAEKIRLALDEIIKQRFGSSKMLINTLNKKIIQEESTLPETAKNTDARDTASTTKPCTSTSFYSSDAISIASEEENLTEFGDLACVLCGAMVVAAGNRLVECSECHSLYHQECHKPPIPDSAANAEDCPWFCYNCKNKYISPNVCSKLTTNDLEAPTATDTTPYIKSPELLTLFPAAKSTSDFSTTNNTKDEATSSQPPTIPTATINIVSSDKRLKLMKKQSKHHDAKRKK